MHCPPGILSPAEEAAQAEMHEERGMGEAQHVSLTASLRMRLFAVLINVLVIAELFVAMYVASQDPARLTPVFFKVFFTMLAPTLAAAIIGRRLIAKAER